MASLFPKVLYFIAGTTPTQDQTDEADAFGPGVAFRNATLIHPDGPIEDADAVAGPNIPENYAEALPNIDDREAVKERIARRNPNLANMTPDKAERRESEADRKARIENALARGERRAPINDRNADPAHPSQRTTQSGDARVTYPDPNNNAGWGTNPETLNDAADRGEGLGSTDGGEGQPGAAPLGPQGEGGPGQRAAPKGSAASGAGNPRGRR